MYDKITRGGSVELWETEKKEFISICSAHDKALLTEKIEMTWEEFERITYITMSLGYVKYTQFLLDKYSIFSDRFNKEFQKEMKILETYPEYYEDEQIYEKYTKWLKEFIEGISNKKVKRKLELNWWR